jgi:hypothetical protein
MTLKAEWRKLAWIVVAFLACFFLPAGWARFASGILRMLHLAKCHAPEAVLLPLAPRLRTSAEAHLDYGSA